MRVAINGVAYVVTREQVERVFDWFGNLGGWQSASGSAFRSQLTRAPDPPKRGRPSSIVREQHGERIRKLLADGHTPGEIVARLLRLKSVGLSESALRSLVERIRRDESPQPKHEENER